MKKISSELESEAIRFKKDNTEILAKYEINSDSLKKEQTEIQELKKVLHDSHSELASKSKIIDTNEIEKQKILEEVNRLTGIIKQLQSELQVFKGPGYNIIDNIIKPDLTSVNINSSETNAGNMKVLDDTK